MTPAERELARWDRHIHGQQILIRRYHPRHFDQFAEAMAYRKAAHDARMEDLQHVDLAARN